MSVHDHCLHVCPCVSMRVSTCVFGVCVFSTWDMSRTATSLPRRCCWHVHLTHVRFDKSRVRFPSFMSRVFAGQQARLRARWFLVMSAPAATPRGHFSRPPRMLVPAGSIFPWVGALVRASVTSVPLQAWCCNLTRALSLARRAQLAWGLCSAH